MLLSHRYQFLFVHIPKTGGSSIRSALRSRIWADPWRIPMVFCSRLSHLSGHRLACKLPRHASAIAAIEMLPRDFYDKLFKFCFVRNPWDLQVSVYYHIQREYPYCLAGISSFEQYLLYAFDCNRPYQYEIDTLIQPQVLFFSDREGNQIVDFIGHFERLEEDFSLVCEKVGLTLRLPQRRVRQQREDYRIHYTDKTAEMVFRHYRRDIERFEFRFD